MKNKYAYRSKISEAKIRQIVRLFVVDLDASQIAAATNLNRNTINRYLTAFRERIARYCESESPVGDEVEVDEGCFGARRVKGVRGEAPMARPLSLACSSVTDADTLRSCQTAQNPLSRE